MNLLVDTHLLLWAAGDPARLSRAARKLLESSETHTWFSSVSIWEIAIKSGLGRKDFVAEPRRLRRGLLDTGWRELALTSEHAVAVGDLPDLHRDPFDRALLAQAHVEAFTLLTSNATVARYPGQIKKV